MAASGLRKAGVAGATVMGLLAKGEAELAAVVCCFYLVVNLVSKGLKG